MWPLLHVRAFVPPLEHGCITWLLPLFALQLLLFSFSLSTPFECSFFSCLPVYITPLPLLCIPLSPIAALLSLLTHICASPCQLPIAFFCPFAPHPCPQSFFPHPLACSTSTFTLVHPMLCPHLCPCCFCPPPCAPILQQPSVAFAPYVACPPHPLKELKKKMFLFSCWVCYAAWLKIKGETHCLCQSRFLFFTLYCMRVYLFFSSPSCVSAP